MDGVGYLGGLAGEVKVSTDALLRRRAATEGIIVESVIGLIKLVTKAIVCVFEVDATIISNGAFPGFSTRG